MSHNHVFVLRILKILNRCHFWHSLMTPRVFAAYGNIFSWKVRRLQIAAYTM